MAFCWALNYRFINLWAPLKNFVSLRKFKWRCFYIEMTRCTRWMHLALQARAFTMFTLAYAHWNGSRQESLLTAQKRTANCCNAHLQFLLNDLRQSWPSETWTTYFRSVSMNRLAYDKLVDYCWQLGKAQRTGNTNCSLVSFFKETFHQVGKPRIMMIWENNSFETNMCVQANANSVIHTNVLGPPSNVVMTPHKVQLA